MESAHPLLHHPDRKFGGRVQVRSGSVELCLPRTSPNLGFVSLLFKLSPLLLQHRGIWGRVLECQGWANIVKNREREETERVGRKGMGYNPPFASTECWSHKVSNVAPTTCWWRRWGERPSRVCNWFVGAKLSMVGPKTIHELFCLVMFKLQTVDRDFHRNLGNINWNLKNLKIFIYLYI